MEKKFDGHIVLIGKADYDSETLAQWTVEWLIHNKITDEPNLYLCSEIDTARASIETPLFEGNPPGLIVINHSDTDEEMRRFSKRVRNAIPECWTVDLLQKEDALPTDPHAFALLKPVYKEDWDHFLDHLFHKAATPQWSRALSNPAS